MRRIAPLLALLAGVSAAQAATIDIAWTQPEDPPERAATQWYVHHRVNGGLWNEFRVTETRATFEAPVAIGDTFEVRINACSAIGFCAVSPVTTVVFTPPSVPTDVSVGIAQ